MLHLLQTSIRGRAGIDEKHLLRRMLCVTVCMYGCVRALCDCVIAWLQIHMILCLRVSQRTKDVDVQDGLVCDAVASHSASSQERS